MASAFICVHLWLIIRIGPFHMNDELLPTQPRLEPEPEPPTLGSSTIYRLCEEVIALREINNRQHKLFEQTLQKSRDAIQVSFNSFAADTQRAYQQLRPG